jgi:RES domain-containing protein
MAWCALSGLPERAVRSLTYRLINSRFPTVGVFDDLGATPAEADAALRAEQLTNPRIEVALGRLRRLPPVAVVTGEGGASIIMAAFIHAAPTGGRFNGPGLGAWYAALEPLTAIEETVYHNTRRLAASEGGFPATIQLRELVVRVDTSFPDLAGDPALAATLLSPDDYGPSQEWAEARRRPWREDGLSGLLYPSVRHPGGQNLCLFDPRDVARPVNQGDHYQYAWDRAGQVKVVKLSK